LYTEGYLEERIERFFSKRWVLKVISAMKLE